MNNDDILSMFAAWDENAENFRGTVLDEEKMARLNRMKYIAGEISALTRCELRVIPFPFTNNERTARVILRGENPILTMDARVVHKIGYLCNLADTMAVSIPEGTNDIQMSFVVWDIWKEWRMENSPFAENKK